MFLYIYFGINLYYICKVDLASKNKYVKIEYEYLSKVNFWKQGTDTKIIENNVKKLKTEKSISKFVEIWMLL